MNNENMMGCDNLSVIICEKSLGADANAEYTLPEYFPEIRKLLHVEPVIMPPTKYVNSSAAQVSGTADFRILYVGADGGLYSAPASSEYSLSIPIETPENMGSVSEFEMACSICPESISYRVTGPRRVSIRCRLRCAILVLGKILLCEDMIGDVDLLSVYKKRESCATAELSASVSDLFEIEYEISPIPEGTRIFDADAKIFIENTRLDKDVINCRGDVILRVIGVDENTGEYMNLSKKIPFERSVEIDAPQGESLVNTRGIASELRVEVEEGRAICKIGVMLEALCVASRDAEYTADVYSSERECQIELREYESAAVLLCKNANITLSERLSGEDIGIPSDARILTSFGNARLDSCKKEDDKYIFDGNARFSVISQQESEYLCTELNLPFRYETDGAFEGDVSSFGGAADVVSMRVSNDGTSFGIDAEIALCAHCIGRKNISAVVEAEFSDAVEKDANALIVCYPSRDDTLWTVAKRYKVAPSKINGDPQTDKYIIIE